MMTRPSDRTSSYDSRCLQGIQMAREAFQDINMDLIAGLPKEDESAGFRSRGA